ncbi:group I intron-associated PD-(D/E)XK endonuclease [Nostoc sp.]|uniref:group I intron-associated PD-(D/E)XK endonuclease n=1 Tax=Nostoc sp. TaxID=1180 RepID=UPI002FFB52FC
MMTSSIEGSLLLHHTKNKGDIAATKAIADLTLKGYLILTPVVCEHLPFDFVAYKDNKCYKIPLLCHFPRGQSRLSLMRQ